MVRRIGRWSKRLLLSVAILVDGALWFLSLEVLIASYWLDAPPLRNMGFSLLLMLAGAHSMLELFPMRWVFRGFDRVLTRYVWPRTKTAEKE